MKTTHFISLLATFATQFALHAQTATQVWVKRYNGPANGNDFANTTAVDSAGNVVITGSSFNASGNYDYYTAKYAAGNGALLWEKRYDGLAHDNDYSNSVAVDIADDVFVTGYSRNASGNDDYYTAKYASGSGALLWERRFNSPVGSYDWGSSVVVDPAGDAVVTGVTVNAGSNIDYYTAKYAGGTGGVFWEKYADGPAHGGDFVSGITVDSGRNVIVTGTAYIGNSNTNGDFYTVKYAALTGAVLWTKTYNGPGNDQDNPSAIAVDAAGNVIVTGSSWGVGTRYDYYTAKYAAADGALLWEKRYNGPGNSDDTPASLAVDSAGNVVVTGYSTSIVGGQDYYTTKYAAADGALLWAKRYDGPASSADYASKVALDTANNVVVTG